MTLKYIWRSLQSRLSFPQLVLNEHDDDDDDDDDTCISELYKIRPQLMKLFIRNHTRSFDQMISTLSMTLAILQGHQTVLHQISRLKRCMIRHVCCVLYIRCTLYRLVTALGLYCIFRALRTCRARSKIAMVARSLWRHRWTCGPLNIWSWRYVWRSDKFYRGHVTQATPLFRIFICPFWRKCPRAPVCQIWSL